MRRILIDKVTRIVKLKKKIEEELEISLTNKGKEFFIDGSAENEYLAEKIIEALDFGFPLEEALMIRDEEFIFDKVRIKDHTKRDDLPRIRGRIIGTQGRTLETISSLTNCFLQLKENEVGIIGPAESIRFTEGAIISLIKGAKQANVYAHLEKNHPQPILDFGIKDEKKKS